MVGLMATLRELVDDVLLVAENDVRSTIRRLARERRMIVEGSAALPVAAALADRGRFDGPVVAIVTGGSIDDTVLAGILAEESP